MLLVVDLDVCMSVVLEDVQPYKLLLVDDDTIPSASTSLCAASCVYRRGNLTDSEVSLQTIHRWIVCRAKLNLSKSPDADVLKSIRLKLQRQVDAGATTLLIKVKPHWGDPLNEEADIRTELGRLNECKETIWNDSSVRTVYQ